MIGFEPEGKLRPGEDRQDGSGCRQDAKAKGAAAVQAN
jgi:hypothetical protein